MMNTSRYPTDSEAKKLIVEIGKRMYAKNFVAANDGNISCKVADDVIWTTPTGVSKGFMTEDILVKMKLDGTILEQGPIGPSSEGKMHLRIYHENPEVGAVCHAHPPISTSFAVAGMSLSRPFYPEAFVNLGTVPCVHYESPGSQGVPDSIAPYCKDYNAVMLGNHGPVAWGKDLMQAWYRLEAIEHYAEITIYTNLIGRANLLCKEQLEDLLRLREKLGIKGGGIPPCAPHITNDKDDACGNGAILPEKDDSLCSGIRISPAQIREIAAEVVRQLKAE